MINGPSVGYEYDNLNRIISRSYFGNIAEEIVYEDGSNRVQSHTVGENTYYYTYDDNGNITSISDDDGFVDYTYDSQNQLIREDNGWDRKTFVWTYDNAGNITSEKEYAYTLGVPGTLISTKNYTYGNATWGDLLTGYNGKTITYDAIGNPRNDGTWQYTWVQGRQLVQMAKTGETWNFTYDADGLRTSRSNGTTAYNYVYSDGQLRQMTCGSNKLVFAYGVDGRPYALQYNGTYYYYLLNLQGDVIGIANTSGTQVVTYNYDAWGNILSISGSSASTLGQLNPLRYRGYVYDSETGLYYLQTRYYNPEIGRFINADGMVATGQGLNGNNMFAYCGNNPISNVDYAGTRYCAATTVAGESAYERRISCYEQKIVALQKIGKVVDITIDLFTFMRENVADLKEYKKKNGTTKAWVYFYNNVKDFGSLDIKRQDAWKFEEGKTYIFNGMVLRHDDPGNINFGYVGAAIFPEIILCAGAGANQFKNHGFEYGDIFTFFDDPRDNQMIRYGYWLYMGER